MGLLRTTGIGGTIGFIINLHQERIYHAARKRSPDGKAAPEVRLQWAAIGGVIFPVG